MSNKRSSGVPWLVLMSFLGGLSGVGLLAAPAADLNLKVELIWGTDGDKPNDPQLHDLTPKLEEKLRRVFKWKHYWEVGSSHSVPIPVQVTRKVLMSHKCELEIKNLGDSTIEVKLYGEGKFVKKIRQPMKAGECSVLAGDDKNDNAWFVVLSLNDR
ncbi:MAG: hypothetical protein ACYDH9_11940 [Limisphaerales bacterium]